MAFTLFFHSSAVLKEHMLFLVWISLYIYREHGSGHAPKTYFYGSGRVVELSVSIVLCLIPHLGIPELL